MNDKTARQAQDVMSAAQSGRIPENMQAFAEDTVVKTREAFDKVTAAARDGAKAFEDVLRSVEAGAKAIGEKMIENTDANAQAAFKAAEAMARAGTLPEIARLQAEFMQSQLVAANRQSRELFELTSRMTQNAFATMNASASRSFEQTRAGR